MFNVDAIRSEFPALRRQINGRPVVYADNPGGTQVHRSVSEAVSDYLLHRNANNGGAFLTSELTEETVGEARRAMADFLNAASPAEIVFGPNMTSLTFAISRAIGRTLQEGDEIVVTLLDHDANFSPWTALAERGAVVRKVDVRLQDVTLDLSDLEQTLSRHTRVVAVGHASNASGTINPIADIVEMVRAVAPQAIVYVDAVQSAPHVPLDVQALGCDFLACSSYKFFSTHQGIVWGRYELWDRLPAYKVRPADDDPPQKWETGTKAFELMAGVTAVVDYLELLGDGQDRRHRLHSAMTHIRAYERQLTARLLQGLATIPGLTIHGITDENRLDERVPTVALTVEGRTAKSLAAALAREGIFAWHGNYYALNVMERLGLEPDGALRLGLVHYNTMAEVERIVEALREIVSAR